MSDALDPSTPCTAMLRAIGPAAGAGVRVRETTPQIAATILRGNVAGFAARLKSAFDVDLVPGNKVSSGNALRLVGTGPHTWLAFRDGGDDFIAALRQGLGETAAVIDQSSGYAVLEIGGDKARALFEKGLGIDLHPRAFKPGDAASTSCAALNVVIHQVDATPTYEVAVARSFAAAFCHWLAASGGEFGIEVLA